MAALTVTPANVIAGAGAGVQLGQIIGELLTAGQVVYKKGSDQRWYKAKAAGTLDESGAGASLGFGIVLTGGSPGQRCEVQTSGPITIGAAVVAGTIYGVGPALAGDIAPNADVVPTNYVSILGVAISATVILLTPMATGIAHA